MGSPVGAEGERIALVVVLCVERLATVSSIFVEGLLLPAGLGRVHLQQEAGSFAKIGAWETELQ